jgi:deoxyribonucleoside regulator
VKNPDSYIERLIEVSRAYYLENQTQAEIARGLGISRSLVSRYLTAAREMGIVQIRIAAPQETSLLGEQIKHYFSHLKEVVVVPSFSYDPDAVRAMIGRFAANYLMEVLGSGEQLALGCGRTLRAMVDALQKRQIPNVTVVQAMGNIGHEAHDIDYNEIARRAAEAFGGKTHYLSAPAILGIGSGSELVEANPSLKHSLLLAKNANLYVVGLGSLESDQLYVRTGLIREKELDDLKTHAVGDICGRFFDVDGQEQPSAFADRIVGIELDDLRRANMSIGVAGGRDKALPLLGALRGQFINVLISDEQTLEHLLGIVEGRGIGN